MLEWSKYFQTPKYLDLYRKMTLVEDFKGVIAEWIGLHDHMKILDVGCGTGAFCYYLSGATEGSSFTGLDIDETFISAAKDKANKDHTSNQFHFVVGDALALPFEDNSFDLVVSYTVLTNLPDGKKALEEMTRVVKPGGQVVSVTAQTFQYYTGFDGFYPSSYNYYYPAYKYYRQKASKTYEATQPQSEYVQYGTRPERVPLLFGQSCLEEVKAHPLSYAFSLSNAIYSSEEKQAFIQEMYEAELEKFRNYRKVPAFNAQWSEEEAQKYESLLQSHRDALSEHPDENEIWDWFGGAQLLISGRKKTTVGDEQG